MDFLIDTTFLIDLWREQKRPGPATRFAMEHDGETAGLPWIVMGEFLRGTYAAGITREQVEPFLDAYLIVWPGRETVDRYARLFTELRKTNHLIGPNDLWIAASALEYGIPMVTRNREEFERVKGLTVLSYG
jgi:predicted nucleic acid-binding protein